MAGELPVLEWWPDYGGDLFWLAHGRGGSRVDMDGLGLSAPFQDATRLWLSGYDDERLPAGGPGDADWLAEGVRLLALARSELSGRYEVVVTEPWWGGA